MRLFKTGKCMHSCLLRNEINWNKDIKFTGLILWRLFRQELSWILLINPASLFPPSNRQKGRTKVILIFGLLYNIYFNVNIIIMYTSKVFHLMITTLFSSFCHEISNYFYFILRVFLNCHTDTHTWKWNKKFILF